MCLMLLLLLLLCRYTKGSCILNGENPLPALSWGYCS